MNSILAIATDSDMLPGAGPLVHVSSARTAVAHLLWDDPIAVVCTARGPLGTFRQLVQTAARRRVPLLLLTGERDFLFEPAHFLNTLPGPRRVEFQPCGADRVVSALRAVMACSDPRPRDQRKVQPIQGALAP